MTVSPIARVSAGHRASVARPAILQLPPASTPWRRGVSALVFAFATVTANAAPDPKLDARVDVAALLTKIQQSAQQQNYVGTYIHQQGAQVQSSRVTHLLDKGSEFEKLELMDGQAREFVRHNDDVRCYVPDSRLLLVEKRARYDTFPALLTTTAESVEQYYRLSTGDIDRIAGHAAQEVVLEAKDRQRYGYRLWYDRDTFLLLKAQTIGDRGAVIEQVAFSDVAIGGSIDPARVRTTFPNTEGWRVETNRMIPIDLGKLGWTVTEPVPGFHKVMEVRRAFGGREDVGQIVYSDGLASISIFIEAHAPKDAVEGDASKGPVNVVTRRHNDYWLTVVGDAPADAVRQMASRIDLKAAAKASAEH
jgi:sigma-E factor negative regulatory protein RseB